MFHLNQQKKYVKYQTQKTIDTNNKLCNSGKSNWNYRARLRISV